jgi:hypothetical protein
LQQGLLRTIIELQNYDLMLNWKRISKGLPKAKNASNDRASTIEEIRKLVEYPDRRIKPIVYAMASGGFRLGAWDYLQWKHVFPITNGGTKDGEVIAAKLIIYADEPEEYYTFITPEAYYALKDWIDFRMSYGENITGESWLMRDLWQTTNMNYGARWGLATNPKRLQSLAVKRLLDRSLWEQGIRHTLPEGKKRHEWKGAHGYRKFYKSRAEQVMKPANVEVTMGHDLKCVAKSRLDAEVKTIQKWDGSRPSIQPLLRDFRRWLIQKRIDDVEELKKQEKFQMTVSKNQQPINTIKWIEKGIIDHPLSDHRKYIIWRILSPYLLNVKKLPKEEAYSVMKEWLDKCNESEELNFNPKIKIKNGLKGASKGYFPISIDKLKEENKSLYDLILNKIEYDK